MQQASPARAVALHPDGHMIEFTVTVDIRSSAESDLLLGDGMFKAALAALDPAARNLQTKEGTP